MNGHSEEIFVERGAENFNSYKVISHLLAEEGIEIDESTYSIPARLNKSLLPLSYGQQRMWFLSQLATDLPYYHVRSALDMEGDLDIAVLRRSLNDIVDRHEVLRTTFHTCTGQPVQHLATDIDIPLPLEEVDAPPGVEQEAALIQCLKREICRPFDLEKGPLLRARLLRLNPQRHVLVLTIHHIVMDGWSMGVFRRELEIFYNTYATGRTLSLPPLPIQYADFAHWQRNQEEHWAPHWEYWRARLSDAPQRLELPTDHPRPAVQSFRGGGYSFPVSAPLSTALRELSRRENITLFMVLLASFKVLLHRYTQQEDLVVGSPTASRNWPEVEGLIGCFINTVVFRTDLSGNPTFRELLSRVRAGTLEAYAHQDLPFDRLVEELQPERHSSFHSLFQVMFVMQNVPIDRLELEGLKLREIDAQIDTSRFDLTLTMEDTGESLLGRIEYSRDLFEETTIRRMFDCFKTLLERVVRNPDQRIADIPLLTEAEYRSLGRGVGHSLYPQDQSLVALFDAQVERSPEAPAVVCGDQQFSYRQLQTRANQLAHRLIAQEVGPEKRVGLCVERSVDLVVGIVAILKAGGAYVPLDLSYPSERLAYQLADAQVAVLLTQGSLVDRMPADVPLLLVDEASLAAESSAPPAVALAVDNLAYVIYTSGSTGQPKGVGVSHRQIVRLFSATQDWFHFGEQDVWTLFHSIAFDFSVWELWGPLLHGGRLVVVPYLVSRSPDMFYQLVRDEGVTVLNQTPSAFNQFMAAEEEAGRSALQHSLRLVIFGGEALVYDNLKPWFERHAEDAPQLVNMYGITETTVHVTYHPIRHTDVEERGGSLIGHPIPDLQVHVLDRALQPVPVGVYGELYVGGSGVALGYLGRSGLTASRFVPDPFSSEAGQRLYRTGDQARYRSDGTLEFLGRTDRQVKIRGFRIELGEIEETLRKCPGVREVAVLARGKSPDGKRLVAYVVCGREESCSVDELRFFLERQLPAYMVPATFVRMAEFPLTSNGKIDYGALPESGTERPELGRAYVAPNTPVEKALTDIWSEIIAVEQVGIDDNFFALGGDSIRSIQFLSKAREKGIKIDLHQVFQFQTVRQLAPVVAAEGSQYTDNRSEPFSLLNEEDRVRLPDDVEDAYPMTMMQKGVIYHLKNTEYDSAYHNVDSFRVRAPFHAESFRQAVGQVVKRHAILRTAFDLTTFTEPMQLVYKAVSQSVDIEDLRHLSSEQQDRVLENYVEQERQHPFDLDHPPLIRFHIHRLSEDFIQFTVTECHAIFDGWSFTSTLSEIFNLFILYLRGGAIAEKPPASISFRDYVQMEREALESEEHKRFWGNRLQGTATTELPKRTNPPSERYDRRIYTQRVPIPPDLFARLERLTQRLSIPFKSILLSVHAKVMSFLGGRTDVIVSLPTNGRPEEIDGTEVRGLFLNVLPLRIKLGKDSWEELARKVFEAEQEVLPFRRYPLVALQNDKGGERLFEAVFNFIQFHSLDNVPDEIEIEGITRSFNETEFPLLVSFSLNHEFWPDEESPLGLILQGDTEKLCPEQVRAIGCYYFNALQTMVAHPQALHDKVSLLTAAERHRQLVSWNASAQPVSSESLGTLFSRQAQRTPTAVAVVDGEQQLSYAALDAAANRLAHYLRQQGVRLERRVGVCMERSIDAVVALLGIVKAGGVYVPLDPSYPIDRLRLLLADAQVEWVLTRPETRPALAALEVAKIDVTAHAEAIAGCAPEPPAVPVTADYLAYVIYTSGSTGQPKGVMVSHRSVTRLVGHTDYIAVEPTDCIGHASTLAFDAATFEIWGALLNGARLVVVAKEELLVPPMLTQRLERHQVSVLFLTTALFNQLAQERPQAFQRLRVVLFGGERVDPQWVRTVCAAGKPTQLLHVYGPTENTTFTTWQAVESVAEQAATVPIGGPIGNTQVYVLDETMQPVPVGVGGELYVGGVGLARGYEGSGGLTASRFVPDPWSGDAGRRLYRTGDQVRWRTDGTLEFVGRLDDQVKLRGFRIEPGEIEARLASHPQVRQAVVVVREEESGPRRLVAYVVEEDAEVEAEAAAGNGAAWTGGLRAYLAERLPDYMVPSSYVVLAALPLTANGKVDRGALPTPEQPVEAEAYVAPRTPVEQTLAQIWADVLHVERVGAEDNFFELGGNSLHLVQLISRIQKIFLVKLPLHKAFNAVNVADMAQIVKECEVQSGRTEKIASVIRRVENMNDAERKQFMTGGGKEIIQ